jgi:CRISPR/Cas system-associated protein Cas7 (RAMP superfamily)
MTDGMKSGAGSDPFADDSSDDAGETTERANQGTDKSSTAKVQTEEEETSSQPDSNISGSSTAPSGDELPYIFARNGVKDNRKMVQYFLQAETEDVEAEAKYAVEQELGTDLYLTDIREALVRIGAEHIDEVADELREWGYRYKEE